MADEHRRLLDLDRTIHEPARLTIVAILSVLEKADFLYVLRETGLTKGNLNSHMTRLEQAGYVAVEKTYRGKIPQTLYSLTKTGRAVFTDYRKRLREAIDPGG
jgi:DNA-binding transcriptional ArsR family regulator